jgi:ELWxxDGT repeat protein
VLLTAFDGKLVFGADNGVTGRELYEFDGISATLIDDINPGPAASNPREFFIFQGQLFFQAENVETGRELYAYDGVDVRRLSDLNPGPANSFSLEVDMFAELDGRLYFGANDGRLGDELYTLFVVPEPWFGPCHGLLSLAVYGILRRKRLHYSQRLIGNCIQ